MPTSTNDRLTLILNNYKLTEPIVDSVQKDFFRSRERILIQTLKNINKYSLLTLLITKLLFKTMNIGIKLTFVQAKIIVITGIVFVTASVSTGSYVTYKALNQKQNDTHIKKIIPPTLKPETKLKTNHIAITKKAVPPKPLQINFPQLITKDKIGFRPLVTNTKIKGIGKTINTILWDYLKQAAPDNFIRTDNNSSVAVTSALVGSINRNAKNYTLIIRLIDAENGKILWGSVIKFSQDNKQKLCSDVVTRLINHLNKRQ